MAYKEVEVGAYEPPKGRQFVRFAAIGDKFIGEFESHNHIDKNKFGKPEEQYLFKNESGEWTITANYDLHLRFSKAGLKPGHKVKVMYVRDQPIEGSTYGLKQFRVMVDDSAPAQAKGDADVPF